MYQHRCGVWMRIYQEEKQVMLCDSGQESIKGNKTDLSVVKDTWSITRNKGEVSLCYHCAQPQLCRYFKCTKDKI